MTHRVRSSPTPRPALRAARDSTRASSRAVRSGLALRLLLGAVLGVVLAPGRARAIDLNVAGSVQVDYMIAPLLLSPARPPSLLLDGFTTEASLKLVADLTPHVAMTVKACFSCHGLEVGMAFAELRVADELNFRVGRFNPTFGEFQLRHDVATHRTSDRPLPYDMGRMIYLAQFNRSVLPTPYVDQGIEVFGSHSFGNAMQLEYAAHAVAGLRSLDDRPTDVDFIAHRQPAPYLIDNNVVPSFGGRVGMTFRLAERVDLTLGASVSHGPYNNAQDLNYTLVGADMFLRLGRTNIRAEYLLRRTEMTPRAEMYEAREAPGPNGDVASPPFMAKDGWYVELEQPVGRVVDLIARWDGLHRFGNVVQGSPLDVDAGMMRWTLGAQFNVTRGFRLKASGELYSIWGVRGAAPWQVVGHLGAVVSF